MNFANGKWFDRPVTKLRALGYNTNLNPAKQTPLVVTSASGVAQSLLANGGLEQAQLRVLAINTTLVRFSSGVLIPTVAAGEWWLDWDAYKIVEGQADAANLSVPVALRQLCCVPLEWNDMTTVVQARVIQPLLAYEGFGAPATMQGGNEHLDGAQAKALGLKQLFIPGLSDPDLRRDALLVTGYGLMPDSLSRTGYRPQAMP